MVIKMGLIYLIKNKKTGKMYIGMTTKTLNERKNAHLKTSKNKPTIYLYRSFKKYGNESFEWEIIEDDICAEQLGKKEQEYIKKYNTKAPNGYNLTDGGEGALNPSKCVRKKLSFANRKEKNPMWGKSPSGKTRIKMSNSSRGKSLFGFTGACLNKNRNHELRCWESRIYYNNRLKSLGYYHDPLTCQIVHDSVLNAIHNPCT